MNALGSMIPFVGQGISTVLSARAARDQADRERMEAEFQAKQLEQQSGQEKAASQRVAADESRRERYAVSRAQAVAAASGAGGGDKTVTDVIGRIAQEGAYRSSVALYQGDAEARQMLIRAEGVRASGRASESAWNTAGQISLLNNASSLYSKYGRNSPGTTSTAPMPSGGFSEGSYLDAGSQADMEIA